MPKSPGTNSLIIGGLDNDRGDITTGPVFRLNSEAIEEFRVTTANGNANQGRSSGSQINIVTKRVPTLGTGPHQSFTAPEVSPRMIGSTIMLSPT